MIQEGNDKIAGELVDTICGDASSTAYCRLKIPADGRNNVSIGLTEAISNFILLEVGLPLGYTMLRLNYDPVILEKNLRLANAFIKRYWIVRDKMPEKRLGTFFSELARQLIEDVEEEASTEFIRNQMLSYDKQTKDQILTDKIFIERLATQQVLNSKKATHLFVSILQYEARKKGEVFEMSSDMTIEHILPQDWDSKLSGWEHFNAEQHQSLHRRLGNLMLLTRKENELVARKPFPEKTLVYGDAKYKEATFISKFDGWSEDSIRQRQEEIAKELCKVWKVSV